MVYDFYEKYTIILINKSNLDLPGLLKVEQFKNGSLNNCLNKILSIFSKKSALCVCFILVLFFLFEIAIKNLSINFRNDLKYINKCYKY